MRARLAAVRTLRQTRDPRMGRLIQSPDGGSNQSKTDLPPRRKPRYNDQIEILGLNSMKPTSGKPGAVQGPALPP